MIVSHRHRFIFLKTRKTAGTSIEIELAKLCGPDDVISRTGGDEGAALGHPGARNDRIPLHRLTRHGLRRSWEMKELPRVYNHMRAVEVRRLVGAAVFDGYVTFAVDRNPWDAAVSFHDWKNHNDPAPVDFGSFVQSRRMRTIARNGEVYRVDGEVAVDKLCRYENLQDDLDEVCDRIGIPHLELPRAKGSVRRHGHYRDVISPADAERIGEMCAPVIRTLRYTF